MPEQVPNQSRRTSQLLKDWLNAPEGLASCTECADHMDVLAELLLANAAPIGTLALLEEHIRTCHCCHGEFQALVAILKMEQTATDDLAPQ